MARDRDAARLATIADTWADVRSMSGRTAKIERISRTLAAISPEDAPVCVALLSGRLPGGRVGVGPAVLREVLPADPADRSTLTLGDLASTLRDLAAEHGPGSRARKTHLLGTLFAAATDREQSFLAHLLAGELRQGAQEDLVLEALARASSLDPGAVRRAVMVRGDAGLVGREALSGEGGVLAGEGVRLFRPLKPMLASPAAGVADALERIVRPALEYKLDGARVQVHKDGELVRVYTRKLRDETEALPDVAERVRALPVTSIVLDGEALALREDGRPRPFQETMRRFTRVRDVAAAVRRVPLHVFFFDCLYLEGESLIDLPMSDRVAVLVDAVPQDQLVPRLVTDDVDTARGFLAAARAAGHEGLVAKELTAPYAAGRRGRAWLKIKPTHTADLVVLAAEWGHGRRKGWLSNLHLGARGDTPGELVMVGKTFKGMTDEVLAWQTEHLLGLAMERQRHVVRVRPEAVVEIAFDGVQSSPRYPGGVALRFARLRGYRPDKDPIEADTIETLRRVRDAGL